MRSSCLMNSADSCSPPHTWLAPADSSCKAHHCFVQCKDYYFVLCLYLRTKPGLNCDFFPLPALCRSVIHRRAASLGGMQAACQVCLFWPVCSTGFHIPTQGWSDLECFTKLHVGLLILLSKQCFFALPFSSSLFTVHTSFYYALVLKKSLKMKFLNMKFLNMKLIAIMVVSFLWFYWSCKDRM